MSLKALVNSGNKLLCPDNTAVRKIPGPVEEPTYFTQFRTCLGGMGDVGAGSACHETL